MTEQEKEATVQVVCVLDSTVQEGESSTHWGVVFTCNKKGKLIAQVSKEDAKAMKLAGRIE